MISFHQFRLNLKEALSLDDPLAQSTLKIKDKYPNIIKFESKLDNNIYEIIINTLPTTIEIEDEDYSQTELDTLNLMGITLKSNGLYSLTNQSGMKANIVYNMLLNAIKQANDNDRLVTLGIKPTRPDTGYGYIEFEDTGVVILKFTNGAIGTATKLIK